MTTMSPGARTGRRTCSDISKVLAPLIGPSMTQGRASRSHRNAARKSERLPFAERRFGDRERRARSLAHRPWERVMLVFAQVPASINDKPPRSIVA